MEVLLGVITCAKYSPVHAVLCTWVCVYVTHCLLLHYFFHVHSIREFIARKKSEKKKKCCIHSLTNNMILNITICAKKCHRHVLG